MPLGARPAPVYESGLARYVERDTVTLKAAGAETASTNGAAVELGDAASLFLTLAVTVVTGTLPTMTVNVQGSDDNTNWFTIAQIGASGTVFGDAASAPTNFTAVATVRCCIPAPRYVRYASTIGGTSPSFTYSLTGNGTPA